MPRRTDAIGPDNTLRPPVAAPRRPTSRTRLYSLADASSSSSLVGAGASAASNAVANEPGEVGLRTRPALSPPDNMRRQREEAKKRKAQTKRRKEAAVAVSTAGTGVTAQPAAGPSRAAVEQTRPRSRQATRLETLAAAALLPQTAQEPPRGSRTRRTVGPAARSEAAADAPRSAMPSSQLSHAAVSDRASAAGHVHQTALAPESSTAARDAADAAAAAEIAAVAAEMASRPRTDIYSADFLGGAPGAEMLLDAEEDQPPPYPEGATRPLTPPGPPGSPEGPGGCWSARQLREQQEAESRRVPDSPPPPFRSDSESDEAEDGPVAAVSAWEQDLRDGLSFDERLRREMARRSAELGPASDDEDRAPSRARSDDPDTAACFAEVVGTSEPHQTEMPDVLQTEEVAREAALARPDTLDAGSTASVVSHTALPDTDEVRGSMPVDGIVRPSSATQPESAPSVVAAAPEINLGALVMEARQRRRLQASEESPERDPPPSDTVAAIATGSPSPATSPASLSARPQVDQSTPISRATRPDAPRTQANRASGDISRRERSADPTGLLSSLASPPASGELPPRAVPRAGKPRQDASRAANPQDSSQSAPRLRPESRSSLRGGITRIRPRPTSEAHSRFRDDAAAAAQRRSALWAGGRPDPRPFVLAQAPAVQHAADVPVALPVEHLEDESSASTRSTTSPLASDSDESDAAWEEEHRALAALRSAERQPVSPFSSADEAPPSGRVPGSWRRSASRDRLPSEPSSDERFNARAPGSLSARTSASSIEQTSSVFSPRDAGLPQRRDRESPSGRPATFSPAPAALPSIPARSSDSSAPHIEPGRGRDSVISALLSSAADGTTGPPSSDKGKTPVRPIDWLLSASTSEHQPQVARSSSPAREQAQPELERAGTFVELDGTSDSFASSSEDDPDRTILDSQPRPSSSVALEPQMSSRERQAVNHRLRGLFATPLSGSGITETAAHLAGDPTRSPRDARASQILDRSAEHLASKPAVLSSPPVQNTAVTHREHQLREQALTDISRLRSSSSTGQDSLSALEALLQRGLRQSYAPPSSASSASVLRDVQASSNPAASSGISTTPHVRPASFVNPRSSMAPRPLGRLPTITAATRHFAPSSQHGENDARQVRSPQLATGRSVRDAELLDVIPATERTALSAPLIPSRRSTNVSAMVSRFEAVSRAPDERSEGDSTHATARTPADSSSRTATDQDLDRRMSKLRRRPPPPPPRGAPPSRASAASALDPTPQSSWASAAEHEDGGPSTKSPRTQTLDVLTSAGSRMPRSPLLLPEDPSRVTASLAAGLAASSRRTAVTAAGGFQRPLPDPPVAQPEPAWSSLSAAELSAARARGTAAGSSPRPARPLPVPPGTPGPARPSSVAAFDSPSGTAVNETMAAELVSGAALRTSASGLRASHDAASDGSGAERNAAVSHTRNSSTSATEHSDPLAHGGVPLSEETEARQERTQGLVEFTDLDLLASRLELEGPHYDELAAIAEFIGPAKETRASAEDLANVGVGVVELLSRRVNKEGKVKQKLGVAGIRVEKCGICLAQFRDGQRACIFPCLHFFHEACATVLLRNARTCPVCRQPIGATA